MIEDIIGISTPIKRALIHALKEGVEFIFTPREYSKAQ